MKSKLLTAVVAIVIAFGLWAYVVTNVSVEETATLHNVPVVFQNEGALTGRNLMLTDGTDQTVTLNITGTRSEILKLRPDNVSVVVDLSRIYDAGRQGVQYTVNYPADVVTSDFEYTADNSRIYLTVEEHVTKAVDVFYEYNGRVADGYMVDRETIQLDHRRINVSGPASVVDQITQARFVINLEGLTAPLDQDYAYILYDAEGNPVEVPNVEYVQTDVELIHVNLSIQRYKEIALKLNVISGGGATEETSSISLETETILVSGTDEVLENLDYLVIGEVDLAEIRETTKLNYPIVMPEGVTNRTGVEDVDVTISFPALTTKTFTITNIHAVNIPADAQGTVVTKQINVTIRGPRSIVLRMQTSDITVTVDFGDMEIGATVTRQPTVTISANYPGVGIIDNGAVTISLQELPPETEPDPTDEPPTDPEA